jgi:hypothetical protein
MTPGTTYSIDTSALMDGMKRYYPPATFTQLWVQIDGLIEAGRLLASEEVAEEVKVHDDELRDWVHSRAGRLIVPTDARIASEVTRVLTVNPRLAGNIRGRNRADAFVIALASLRGATVVTGEGHNGTADRPKIPYVCQQLGIPCIRLLEVIIAEGWTF